MSDALYLYGFVPPDAAAPPAALGGVAGRPVKMIDLGPVRAAVSSVPAADFAAERIEERVHELEWVAEQGALHERIVTWFVDHGEIVPARLLTLYSGADALAASLSDRGEAILAELKRLEGLREWDLKVSYDARTLQEHLGEASEAVASLDRELAAAAPGRRYLLERKRARLAADETLDAARRLAGALYEALEADSVEARRVALPRDAAELPVVLNAALLVSRDREQDVRRTAARDAERLGRLGVDAQLTGPWAPYRFLREPDAGS